MPLRLHFVAILLASCSAPATAPPDPRLRESVDAAVKPFIDSGKHMGLAVGVLRDGRHDVFGYGRTSAAVATPPDGTTIFEIGSITKTFTGTLLMQAVAEGKLSLKDPIRKHLPPSVRVPVRGAREILVVDLATHHSGLPFMPDNLVIKNYSDPYGDYGFPELYACLRETELSRDPGEAYEYSNLGMGLLGHLLELTFGRTYEPLVVERISRPLGLRDTLVSLSPDQKRRLAPGHRSGGTPVSNWDSWAVFAGAGSLRSTANDILRYLEANLGESFDAAHMTRANIGKGARIGLGWHLSPLTPKGPTIVWHNGETGGYRCYAGFVKSTRTAVVVLGNTTADADAIGIAILRLLQDVR